MAVPVARGVTPAGVTPGLRSQAWPIEARGLANRSEGLGAGLAQALSTSGTHAQAHTISSLTLQQMARMRSLEE